MSEDTTVDVKKIAQKMLKKVEALSLQAEADVNYCKGAKDGIIGLYEEIRKAAAGETQKETPPQDNPQGETKEDKDSADGGRKKRKR